MIKLIFRQFEISISHITGECASSLQNVMQNIKPRPAPLLTPPPPHFILFYLNFFLLFQKFVAVENKYFVPRLPGNKFSGRVRDENK